MHGSGLKRIKVSKGTWPLSFGWTIKIQRKHGPFWAPKSAQKKNPKPEPLFVALRAQPPRTDFRDGCSSPVILKLPEDSQRENGEKIREKSSVTRKVLQWKSDIHRVFWRWSVSLKAKHRTSAAAAPTTLLRNFDNVEPSATGILLGGAADSGHVLRMFHPDKWDLY